MLYSPSNKVAQYLTQYNIDRVYVSKGSQNVKFILRNLNTDKYYKLEIENPLYNVLSKLDTTSIDFNSNVIDYQLDRLRKLTFSDDQTKTWYVNTYYNSPYRIKYNTLEIEAGKKYASEYFNYLELKDIEKMLVLTGIDATVVTVYGNFVKLSDNTLRFLFNPKYPVLDNVDEVLMCDFYLYTATGQSYPIYYIMYTLPGSTDVYFEQTNLMVNSINNKGSVTVNLSQVFNGVQNNIYDDLKNLTGYNVKQFIVNNLFNCGIYYNADNGIFRYIPVQLDMNFFSYAFNNIGIHNEDGSQSYVNIGEDSNTSKNLNTIINEKRIIPQNDINNIDILGQLLNLSSYASYFNDVLFNLDSSIFNFPIYLVTDSTELVETANYPDQD